jgi:EmrB/QacA subfamily drug resistance transporter
MYSGVQIDGYALPMSAQTLPSGDPGVVLRRSPWLVLSVLCLAFFMILLDTTIVNIAVPDLTTSLDASLDQVLWIVNAYTLVYAVLLITGGRLGDLYGPKRLFLVGLVVFVAASAACGLAHNPGQLIAARMAQGVGGAMLTPQTLAMLTVIFPPERRGAAYGIWGSVAGLATIAGPTLGGWLVTTWSWRWIFYVNLPLGIATMIFGWYVLPDIALNRRHRLDWLGTVLASLGLLGVCFGMIEGPPNSWGRVLGPITSPMLIATGLAFFALFIWQQYVHRDREPLIPLGIFADRNYAVMNGVVAAISFGMLGLFLPLVIFLQSVLGLSALQAGLALAPMSLASVAMAPVAGRFADRYGGKDILITGLCLWAIGIGVVLWSARLYYDRSHLVTGLVIAGVGLGMTFAPLQTIAMHNVAPRMAGAAAGVINTSRQLGAVIGSIAVGTLLQAQLATRLPVSAAANADALPESFRFRFIDGFTKASAAKGLAVGIGQTGARLPADLPASVRPAVLQVGQKTFYEAYVPTMHITLILPLTVLTLAVCAAMFVRHAQDQDEDERSGKAAGAEGAAATHPAENEADDPTEAPAEVPSAREAATAAQE